MNDGRSTIDDDVPIRLGAVSYLNTRPLVHGLEQETGRFTLRFDVPAKCAELLHAGAVDLGLIPSIEYPGRDYRIVPDLSIASAGPVASVAIFTKVPTERIRSIALDVSSRTSIALLRVLCARWFAIEPALVGMAPDVTRMLGQCDAALVIGDNALFMDHDALGLEKVDLGEEWIGMTGLPFVYAFWAGRPGVADEEDIAALQRARNGGVTQSETIAREYFPDSLEHQAVGARYLRDNIKYYLGDEERAGLERFYAYAVEAGVVEKMIAPECYGQP